MPVTLPAVPSSSEVELRPLAGPLARAWPFALFAVLVAALLGPSLVGARVALPTDLLLQRQPWAAVADAPDPANVELRDQIDTYYPVQAELVRRLRAGEGADWIHDLSLGMPGTAFIGWGLWSPFNAPAAVLDFSLAWAWAMALRLFAAMAGAYLLVRRLGPGRLGATVAGCAYGLSGFMVLWLGWPQSHVAAVVPWLLWATHHTVAREARWWAGPALATATAALWLAGFPAVAAYGLLAAGILACHCAWRLRDDRWTVLRTLGAAAFAVSLGTGVAAFALMPSVRILEDFSLGYRDGAWRTTLPTWALLTFVAPGFFGDVVHHPLWLGVSYVETVAYTGVVTLLLGAAAWVITPRRTALGLFTATGFGFVLLVYGLPPLRAVLSAAPFLRTNVPTRASVIVCLCLAVAGGFGADALARLVRGEAGWDRRALRRLAGIGTLGAVAFTAVNPPAELRERAYRRFPPELAQAVGDVAGWELAAAAGFCVLAALVVALALRVRRRDPGRAPAVLAAGLLAVLSWDLLAFAGGWNVQAPPAELLPTAPGLEELARTSVSHRVAAERGVLLPNTHLPYGVADARAHTFLSARFLGVLGRLDAERPSPTMWTLDAIDSGRWRPWLPLLGVRSVLVGGDVPRLGAFAVQETGREVGPALTADTVVRGEHRAPDGGSLHGVHVRTGTFGRRNAGELVVRVHTAGGTREGRVPADIAQDLHWLFVPVPELPVRRDELVRVELTATTTDPHQAVALFGEARGGAFSPALALDYGRDLPARPVPGAPGLRLVDFPEAAPVVFAAAGAVPAREGQSLDQLEAMGGEDLTRTVLVEPYGGRGLPALPDGDGTARLVSWQRAGGRVRAEVQSDHGAVVVSLDQALEGWSATVDGRPTPAVRVNHLFVGAVVPSGTHTVELRYRAPLTAAAALTSARSLSGVIGWALLRWVRQRTGKNSKELLLLAIRYGQRRFLRSGSSSSE